MTLLFLLVYYFIRNKILAKLHLCASDDNVYVHSSSLLGWLGISHANMLQKFIYVCNPGGIVDATALTGTQSASATININKACQLRLGNVTLQLGGSPGINLSVTGASVIGLGPGNSTLQVNTGTNDAIQSNAINVQAKGFTINSAVARTAGAGIRCKGGNGVYEDFTIDKTFNGIQVTDSLSGASGNNVFKRIVMGSLSSPAGTWNAGIILGNVAAGTVTGEFFQDVVVIGTSAFADAMLVLDSGCDTNHFTDCQFVQSGTDSFCVAIRNTNTSNAPQWDKFTNCVFESGPTKTGVTVSAGILTNFVNCTLATCGVFFQFNGGTSVHVAECKMVGCQQQAINITAGNDIRITNNRIADSSLQTNGGFNTIQVTANVNDFSISGNDFTTILSSANQPFQNISIPAGTSDRYWIYANTLANFTNVGISDGGTGTNKLVGFNSPFSAGSSKLYGVDLTQASSLNKTTLLNSQDAAAALTGDGTDKTFYTFTLPAATLAAGKGVRVSAFWIHGTGVASITYKLFFGATAVVNASSAVTGNGCFDAIIMNQPASTTAQRASSKFTPTGTATSVTSGNAPAENTANAVVIKATFNVANTDQVTPAQWLVELVQ